MKKLNLLLAMSLLLLLAGCESGGVGSTGKVTDICGNTYKTVKIGSQTWMAENLKCFRYDTESELAGDVVCPSGYSEYFPCYVDATDKSKWFEDEEEMENLTQEQIDKFGYFYNWAAVVGVGNCELQKTEFEGNRQGICPNGWHVPTRKEFSTLVEAMGGNDSAGKAMKSKSGWYDIGSGTDKKGFCALPTGYNYGDRTYDVGVCTYFWTSSVLSNSPQYYANLRYLGYHYDECIDTGADKEKFTSVRCVKN